MMRKALAFTAIGLLLAGCSSAPRFERDRADMTIDPNTFEEINLEMTAGATLQYSWSSTGNLDFDIHSHRGNDIVQWERKTGMASSGTFTADIDGGYSLEWKNSGRNHVSLTYHISGEATEV